MDHADQIWTGSMKSLDAIAMLNTGLKGVTRQTLTLSHERERDHLLRPSAALLLILHCSPGCHRQHYSKHFSAAPIPHGDCTNNSYLELHHGDLFIARCNLSPHPTLGLYSIRYKMSDESSKFHELTCAIFA